MKLVTSAALAAVFAGVFTTCASLGGHKASTGLVDGFKSYVKAADSRDVGSLEDILHPDFRVNFIMAGNEALYKMTKDDYISSAKAGKIGGVKRQIEIHSIEEVDGFGFVRATLTSPKMQFNGSYTLKKDNGEWRIVSDNVMAKKL